MAKDRAAVWSAKRGIQEQGVLQNKTPGLVSRGRFELISHLPPDQQCMVMQVLARPKYQVRHCLESHQTSR
jgi:hypothetical protein